MFHVKHSTTPFIPKWFELVLLASQPQRQLICEGSSFLLTQ
jgi:hypothetical protein